MCFLQTEEPNAVLATLPAPRDWLAEIEDCQIGDGLSWGEVGHRIQRLVGILTDLAREHVMRLGLPDTASAVPTERGPDIGSAAPEAVANAAVRWNLCGYEKLSGELACEHAIPDDKVTAAREIARTREPPHGCYPLSLVDAGKIGLLIGLPSVTRALDYFLEASAAGLQNAEPAAPAPNMHTALHRARMASGPREQPATFSVEDERAPGVNAAHPRKREDGR